MRYRLMGSAAFVDREVNAIGRQWAAAQGLSNALRRLQEMGAQLGGQIRQRFGMTARNHKDMARAQGKCIHQGNAVLVLNHAAGRELALDNSAEQAMCGAGV